MLVRHILGYLPANLVPVLTALATIYVFTRILDPADYGAYALTVSIATMCQAVFFYWLQCGAIRFYPVAVREGFLPRLHATVYRGYGLCILLLAALYAAVMAVLPLDPRLAAALWLGLPLVVVKALVSITQAFHRGALRVARFGIAECGQAVLGLLFALLLVRGLGLGGAGILLGLIGGAAVVALADLPMILRMIAKGAVEQAQLRRLLAFGLPLTASFAFNFILAASDRMLVEYFLGSHAVGIYAVAYGIADRAISSVFLAVSLAAFPLAIRALEQEGAEAARRQMHANGEMLLAVAVPSCAGLVAVADPLAGVMIGADYCGQAAEILPWIAVASLMAGLQVHYFDHAFHLGRRTGMFLLTVGPAAALNVALNLLLLPRLGLIGAVYATVASYLLAVAASAWLGRRVFPFPFPFRPLLRVVAATAAMVAVLTGGSFPAGPLGLAAMIGAGIASYGLAALLLDVAGLRARTTRLVRARAVKEGGS